MSAPIDTYLRYINEKEWASEVRTAIVNAIRECYNNTEDPELRTDALEAAIQVKIDTGQMAVLTIGDGTITAVKLASNSVTTSKIADGNVTTPKIANGSVTAEKLDPNMELVTIDATLSNSGEAADAKVVGDAISELNGSLAATALTDSTRAAILSCFEHAGYTDERGSELYDNLLNELYKDSLIIEYNQQAIVDYGTSLDDLKSDLVVTNRLPNGQTQVVTNYTLSGELNEERSNITVTYQNKKRTFKVACAPADRWVDDVLILPIKKILQGSWSANANDNYTTGSTIRAVYIGTDIDFDPNYKYAISVQGSGTWTVSVSNISKSNMINYANKKNVNRIADSGWKANGFVFNSDGSAHTGTAFLEISFNKGGGAIVPPSYHIESVTITRSLIS